MDGQHLVLLFGESLLLDSVEARLAGCEAVSVMRLRTAAPEVAARLYSLNPDLIIFDLDGDNFRSLIPFLRMESGAPLLGLDINCNQVVTLVPQRHTVLNLEDLCQVIAGKIIAGQIDLADPLGQLTLNDLTVTQQGSFR